jgi:hypothetical protein
VSATQAAPTVVAVAGRRIDAPDAAAARFPLRHRDRVHEAIASALIASRAVALVSSGACGADLLALEAARALGIRRRIVLPFAVDRFRTTSVVDRPGDWGALFDELVADARSRGDLVVLNLGEGDDAYAKANDAIVDEGDALAVAANASKRALIVWDGASRGQDDLTDHFKAHAVSRGWTIEEILTL